MSIQERDHAQRQVMFGGHVEVRFQLLADELNNKKNCFWQKSEKR
jgi:hypothetical protein